MNLDRANYSAYGFSEDQIDLLVAARIPPGIAGKLLWPEILFEPGLLEEIAQGIDDAGKPRIPKPPKTA